MPVSILSFRPASAFSLTTSAGVAASQRGHAQTKSRPQDRRYPRSNDVRQQRVAHRPINNTEVYASRILPPPRTTISPAHRFIKPIASRAGHYRQPHLLRWSASSLGSHAGTARQKHGPSRDNRIKRAKYCAKCRCVFNEGRDWLGLICRFI